MALEWIPLLSILLTQALSAPSGCIESCTSYHGQYQSQTSGGYQDHAGLTQAAANLQSLDYSRPGSWVERNQYGTDGGHGKVHEERGQIVDGPRRVRYFKKNYTSSYSTGHVADAGLSEAELQSANHRQVLLPTSSSVLIPTSQQLLESQRVHDQISNSEVISQQHDYNRIQSQQREHSLRKTNDQIARLEDFGEYSGNTQVNQHGTVDSHSLSSQGQQVETVPGNWRRVDAYNTDGGRGRVFEEEGQIVNGPKKVRYYKRNYTSSYSSTGGIPVPEIPGTGVHHIQTELEKLHKQIGQEFSHISTAGNTAASNIAETNVNTIGLGTDNVHITDSDNYRRRIETEQLAASTAQRNTHQHITDTIAGAVEHIPHTSPIRTTYGSERHSAYERHEGYESRVQPTAQYINPTSGYTSVLTTGNSGYHADTFNTGASQQRVIDDLHRTDLLNAQSRLVQDQLSANENIRQNVYNQRVTALPVTPGQATHYREHWSAASHTREGTIPHLSTDTLHVGEQNAEYNRHRHGDHDSYRATNRFDEQGSYRNQHREHSYDSEHRSSSGRLVTGGSIDLGQVGDNVDCTHETAEQVQYGSRYHRKYKRSAKHDESIDMKHQNDDSTQRNQEFNNQLQHQGHKLENDDLLQQTAQFDDSLPTTGKLEFGQQAEHRYRPKKPTSNQHLEDLTQQSEDLMQQTGGFDDLTQQTSGNLEFGQQSQYPHQSRKPGTESQNLEDLTQQTSGFDDLSQQTTGNLEFGQQLQYSHQSRKPSTGNQHLEDLTQQTSGFDDLSQQTSGSLEFGQQSQYPHQSRKPSTGNQHLEDLTQQTAGFDDLTQQTSGNLEFGQQSQYPHQSRKPSTGNQHLEDLTQQTAGFEDLTQQTSGNLEFGQQSQYPHQSRKPGTGNQNLEDLTQQTAGFDDLTQQTSGNLEFGQQSQYPHQSRKPGTGSQNLEDLTQQTSGFDDLTQQTSGNLEFGQQLQHSHQSRRPGMGSQNLEDLTQQTAGFDDLTQQTSGNLEFGQQSQYPHQSQKPGTGSQHLEDLTQQTSGFDDLSQQTSGNLEFGQQSQYPHQSGKPSTGNQHLEDLTQQTAGFDDLSQQTSGNLEFGQQSQYPHQSRKPSTGNQHLEDLTQQTSGFDDLSQQTSGNLEFGQQSQYPHQSGKPSTGNQHLEDLTQQTAGFDDLSQQTSGNLEFGQQSQYPHQSRRPSTGNQHLEDLTQQTGEFDDLTQQMSGNLEFGHQSQRPYQSRRPGTGSQNLEDLTQQTAGFDDLMQQTSGNLEFGQQVTDEKHIDLQQQGSRQQTGYNDLPKPAEKPRPRQRYTNRRQGDFRVPHSDSGDVSITDIQDIPPKVQAEADTDDVLGEGSRGDQSQRNPVNGHIAKDTNKHTDVNAFEIERGNVDQVNRLHKSNDATVGLQWHYAYHPSDLTNSEPLVSSYYPGLNYNSGSQQKEMGGQLEQHSGSLDFNQQETQNKDTYGSVNQQSLQSNLDQQETQNNYRLGERNQYNNFGQESESQHESETSVFGQQQEPTQKVNHSGPEVDQLEFSRSVKGKTRNSQNQKPQNGATELKMEPRILEAYGGGPYDAGHSDDIYNGVTANPSATLPPFNAADPWDVREKPREMNTWYKEFVTTPAPTEVVVITTETTAPPSFWSRIGHKLTSGFDKAKEKAKDLFG